MPLPILYIGNKNYSSWSFRPWIGMTAAGLPFEERLVPFDMGAGNPAFLEFSPTGRVPVLHDDGLVIPESLAILDHMARKHPESGLWPEDQRLRSLAMAASAEMASSFQALRNACPMNMRRPVRALPDLPAGVISNVARIRRIWENLLDRSGGPFLCGKRFSVADAMYAPVVNRLEIYALDAGPVAQAYMAVVKELPAWQAWEAAGRAEPWIVEEDEA